MSTVPIPAPPTKRMGWILALEQQVAKNGRAYTRIAIVDASTRISSAYNWFRDTKAFIPGAGVRYETQPSADARFTNLVACSVAAAAEAAALGPMPASWAKVAAAVPTPTPTPQPQPAPGIEEYDDVAAEVDGPTDPGDLPVPDWRKVGRLFAEIGKELQR